MFENIYNIICKEIIEDKRTNLSTYLNAFEEIITSKLPGNLPPFSIGTLWRKTSDQPEFLKIRIRFQEPNGSERVLIETQSMEVKNRSHRLNLILEGFPIGGEGIHKFLIELSVDKEWVLTKELLLEVKLGKHP